MKQMVLSASEFRTRMFELGRKVLAKNATDDVTLLVKDTRSGEVLFEVRRPAAAEQEEKKNMKDILELFMKTRGKLKLPKNTINIRRKFNEDMKRRQENYAKIGAR